MAETDEEVQYLQESRLHYGDSKPPFVRTAIPTPENRSTVQLADTDELQVINYRRYPLALGRFFYGTIRLNGLVYIICALPKGWSRGETTDRRGGRTDWFAWQGPNHEFRGPRFDGPVARSAGKVGRKAKRQAASAAVASPFQHPRNPSRQARVNPSLSFNPTLSDSEDSMESDDSLFLRPKNLPRQARNYPALCLNPFRPEDSTESSQDSSSTAATSPFQRSNDPPRQAQVTSEPRYNPFRSERLQKPSQGSSSTAPHQDAIKLMCLTPSQEYSTTIHIKIHKNRETYFSLRLSSARPQMDPNGAVTNESLFEKITRAANRISPSLGEIQVLEATFHEGLGLLDIGQASDSTSRGDWPDLEPLIIIRGEDDTFECFQSHVLAFNKWIDKFSWYVDLRVIAE